MSGQDEKKVKQSVKQVLKNNWFWIRLIFSASPSYLIFIALDTIRNQVSIFFEHTILIGYVLESAETNRSFSEVASVILLMAGLITLGMVFTVIAGDYVQEKERPKVRQKIKMMLYEKAQELDLACYDDPDFYNEEVLALSEVDNQIQRCVTLIQNTLSGVTVFITSFAYFFTKDKWSIIFALISFVLAFIFNQKYNKKNYLVRIESNPFSRKRDYVKRVFYLNNYAKEIRLNPDVSNILFRQFEEANDEVYRIEKKYAWKKFVLDFLRKYLCNDFISDVVYISYLVFQAVVIGALRFSTVAILFSSFGNLKRGLRIFTDVYPYATESSLYIEKIRKFLEYQPQIVSEEGLVPGENAKKVELKNVTFCYSGGQEKPDEAKPMTLNGLNLTIHPGEKIALVGYNGAGKTTLVKLLMRLYDPVSGTVLADGNDIRRYDVEKYRRSIGTVFQDFMIFAGSVKENVVLDVADGKAEEPIRNALTDSGLMDRVNEMQMGLDTPLTNEFSKDGINLSGGEGQKLAIARVFYNKAGLMILDEPSSALDPIAEYQLNHAMMKATKDKTVIFISHRLSTTRLADRIVMLENGQIVEEGTHQELLEKNGKYAQMWKVQAGAYIDVS